MATNGSTSVSKGVEKLLEKMPDIGIVSVRTLKAVVRAVLKALPIGGAGIKVVEGPHGREFHALSANGGRHPFEVTSWANGSGGYNFVVEPGTYNGTTPTLGGVSLNAGPTGSLGTGLRYVYLKVPYTLNTANSYVYSGNATARIIEVSTTEKTDPLGPKGGATADFYILLASYSDGVKIGQPIRTSLTGEICGVSDDSAEANLLVLQS